MNHCNIISVGQLSTIYADFSQYIASYFGFSSPSTTAMSRGFATLFSKDYNFNLNNGIFDAAEFVKIITGSTITSGGAYVADLSGSVNIIGVSNLLRNAVDANPFGNRDPSGGTTAGDPTRRNNYGVSDGFFENDLIFIPNLGITITLQLGIDAEAFPYTLNNKGPAYSNQTRITQDISGSFTVGVTNTSTFSQVTTTSSTLISRVITAPLLIRLANLSHSSITVPSITTTTTSVILNISGGYTYYTVSRGIQ